MKKIILFLKKIFYKNIIKKNKMNDNYPMW